MATLNNNKGLQTADSVSSLKRDVQTSLVQFPIAQYIESDPAEALGTVISSRISSEIEVTDHAIRNAGDVQALIDSAEAPHKEVETILQRMREVAVQVAFETNCADEHFNLASEFSALVHEIDRISSVTKLAGQSLMKKGGSQFAFHVGRTSGDENKVAVFLSSLTSVSLGVHLDVTEGNSSNEEMYSVHNEDGCVANDPGNNDDDLESNPSGRSEINDRKGLAEAISLISATEAFVAISRIDTAIQVVNTQRSELEAVSSRLADRITNLTKLSANLLAVLANT
jgi:flagellin